MYNFLLHFLSKLHTILSTAWGWICGLLLIIGNTLVAHKVVILFVIVVVLLDFVWGIAASLSRHKFATSELMKETVAKFAVYGTAILTFCFIDRLMGESMTLTTAVIGGVIMLVELFSSMGNALIVFPNMPFLRLLRPALKGEIANKLGISPHDVDAAFEAEEKLRRQRKEEKKERKAM